MGIIRKANPTITFFCPQCGQGNEVSIGKALVIEAGTRYIGSGYYIRATNYVGLYCSGCRVTAEIEYKEEVK